MGINDKFRFSGIALTSPLSNQRLCDLAPGGGGCVGAIKVWGRGVLTGAALLLYGWALSWKPCWPYILCLSGEYSVAMIATAQAGELYSQLYILFISLCLANIW